MRYYPLLLDLTGMHCLVIGAGEVGLRKIQGLLQCSPARVTAVDPAPPGMDLAELLARRHNFTYEQRPFTEADLDAAQLVFACTSNRSVNELIGQACMQKGILCNMTDAPEHGNFVLPASITRGDLTISISTSGASPALARVIRQDLEERYGPDFGQHPDRAAGHGPQQRRKPGNISRSGRLRPAGTDQEKRPARMPGTAPGRASHSLASQNRRMV